MRKFSIIVAMDKDNGIGREGGLAWHLPEDMAYFKKITTDSSQGQMNAVIMGRKTWESIPQRFRPLPDRVNVILTRNHDFEAPDGCLVCASLDEALQVLAGRGDIGKVFVIGGASIYEQAIGVPSCQRLYITQIKEACDCDVFFPEIPAHFIKTSEKEEVVQNNLHFSFLEYHHSG